MIVKSALAIAATQSLGHPEIWILNLYGNGERMDLILNFHRQIMNQIQGIEVRPFTPAGPTQAVGVLRAELISEVNPASVKSLNMAGDGQWSFQKNNVPCGTVHIG